MKRTAALALALTAVAAWAQPLDRRLREAIADFPATVSLYAKNLETGKTAGIGEDERVRTASTIKLPIMAAVFAMVEAGEAEWTDELPLAEADKVPGSGILREFSPGVRLRLRDLVHLMIMVSDNTATNLILDRFPPAAINARLASFGLAETRALRKVLGGSRRAPAGERYG
ncbi:MAG: serine hydrolase, partial [Bryobacteraceae bacterium]